MELHGIQILSAPRPQHYSKPFGPGVPRALTRDRPTSETQGLA